VLLIPLVVDNVYEARLHRHRKRDQKDFAREAMSIHTLTPGSIDIMTTLPEIRQRYVSTRFLVDATTAVTAAATVSPIVAAVDK
jgi:hypothetical protein